MALKKGTVCVVGGVAVGVVLGLNDAWYLRHGDLAYFLGVWGGYAFGAAVVASIAIYIAYSIFEKIAARQAKRNAAKAPLNWPGLSDKDE